MYLHVFITYFYNNCIYEVLHRMHSFHFKLRIKKLLYLQMNYNKYITIDDDFNDHLN